MKANLLYLNKRNEFSFESANACAPMGHCKADDLAEMFDRVAADVVVAEFHTSEKYLKADLAKFTRRFAALGPNYTISAWAPKVVRGIEVSGVMACTITRTAPSETPALTLTEKRRVDRLAALRAEHAAMQFTSWRDQVKAGRLAIQILELETA